MKTSQTNGWIVGDEAFEVEWHYDYKKHEGCDEYDMDSGTVGHAYFKTIEEARAKAKEVYPLDFFGAAIIRKAVLTDPHEGTRFAGIRKEFTWETTVEFVEEYTGD